MRFEIHKRLLFFTFNIYVRKKYIYYQRRLRFFKIISRILSQNNIIP